jgi:hypothetical protein
MKIYFIGGTSEYSSKIVKSLREDYNFEVTAVGRSTGHEIPKDNQKILKEALDYDVIINFTYASGYQLDFTINAYKEISESKWDGYFINFGSTIVLHSKSSMDRVNPPWQSIKYHSRKKSIQEAGHYISRRFFDNGFRYTQIQCGMLANKKMQSLQNYRDSCIQATNLSNILNYLINTPSNWHIHEFMIDAL